jgi:general secretion pathway protein E
MATASPKPARVDRKLLLREVADWLVEDGMIEPAVGGRIVDEARFVRGTPKHPIAVLADQRLRSLKPPHGVLHAEALTEWLAARLKMPYYHIDPLEIDLRAVTAVMSSNTRRGAASSRSRWTASR